MAGPRPARLLSPTTTRPSASSRASDGGVELTVELRYHVDVEVEREAVLLRLPGRARMSSGVTLDWQTLAGKLRIDRGTPIVVQIGGLVVSADEGMAAAAYSPADDGNGTEVELIIDDEAGHPFSAWSHCRKSYLVKAPDGIHMRAPSGAIEHRTREARLARHHGDVVRARASLYVAGDDFAPLRVVRGRGGARAAVVVTDHADRTDPIALRAILYGTSDPEAASYGQGGFIGHGLKITKTFFVRPGIGSLEDDPEARELADALVAAGSEVAPHSISPERDSRQVVIDGLPTLAPWKPVTWIDHQPETNCEAITNRGWSDDPEFGIHDLLAAAGYVWVWAALDAPEDGVRMTNVFEPGLPERASPPIFPLPPDPRLWLFVSSWFFDRATVLAAAISDEAIGRLEHERGLFVAHTYLSPSLRTTDSPRHKQLLAVVERPGGVLDIDPALEAALARLGDEVHAGALASLTWREAGERLLALAEVRVRYLTGGGVAVENRGQKSLLGLTVAVPIAAPDLVVDGATELGRRAESTRTTVWFDLHPGTRVVLRTRHAGWPSATAPLIEVQ